MINICEIVIEAVDCVVNPKRGEKRQNDKSCMIHGWVVWEGFAPAVSNISKFFESLVWFDVIVSDFSCSLRTQNI